MSRFAVREEDCVKHYRIRQLDQGGYFIARRRPFSTLQDLIAHYSADPDGLCVQLTKPCVKCRKRQLSPTVWEGRWNNTAPVAVKKLKSATADPADFLAEAQTMKKLRHPKLLTLYAVCTKDQPILIVTELVQENLLSYLQGKGRQCTLLHLVETAAQVAAGMAYLEEMNFTHRDLAARNILTKKNT